MHFPLASLKHFADLVHGSMNVTRLVPHSITDIADVLVALVAMRAGALAHWIQEDMRATVRTAESGGVHLLALANQLRWQPALTRLLWGEARTGSVIEH